MRTTPDVDYSNQPGCRGKGGGGGVMEGGKQGNGGRTEEVTARDNPLRRGGGGWRGRHSVERAVWEVERSGQPPGVAWRGGGGGGDAGGTQR